LLLAMHAVDVGISLRYPTTGETSAVVCALAGMGKPLIVSDVGAFAELPDEFAIKIPVLDEQSMLTTTMRQLSISPEMRQAMAHAARAYAQERTWERVAEQYMAFIERVVATPSLRGK
jgi:glycosyltransferase involved in cell wall biosynthesis